MAAIALDEEVDASLNTSKQEPEGTSGSQEEPEAARWQWPELRFDKQPECAYLVRKQFLPGANNGGTVSARRGKTRQDNFLKGVKWSPDGACFLTCCEDTSLRLFDLPTDVLDDEVHINLHLPPSEDSLTAALVMWEGETVYDYCWYPHMTALDAATCVFASTCRAHPVHLWDAGSGTLRCSYRAYDAMDEVTAAYSVAFSPAGDKLFCGYNKMLRVSETARPGREFREVPTVGPSKEGQTGILSCMSFSPGHADLLAVGSYGRSVGLYRADTLEALCLLRGHAGGVTQLLFSRDGNYLYSGARKDPFIHCWDVRRTGGVLYSLPRQAKGTNQRIAFDIEPCGRHLATGGEDGQVRTFDLTTGESVSCFRAADDTVNGFAFHPLLPLAAMSSGQRHFVLPADSDEEEGAGAGGEGEAESGLQDCIAVWKFPCSWQSTAEQGVADPAPVEVL